MSTDTVMPLVHEQIEAPADPLALEAAAVEPNPEAETLRNHLRERAQGRSLTTKTLFFAVSLGFFIWSFSDRLSTDLPILIVILLFHELGHLAAMRLFGYRNFQVFFLPFLGAAVSGKRSDAPAWQQVLVSLAGPTPGIVVGLVLAVATLFVAPSSWLTTATMLLLIINAFNLLPALPLDGGRVFQILFFSRSRVLEVLALAGGLAVTGLSLISNPIGRGLFGMFALTVVRARWKVLTSVRKLRELDRSWSADVADLPERELLDLAAAAGDLTSGQKQNQRKLQLQYIEALHEVLQAKAPSWGQTLLLMGAWALPVVLTLGAAFLLFAPPTIGWSTRVETAHGFQVDLPGPVSIEQVIPDSKITENRTRFSASGGRFVVEVLDIRISPEDAAHRARLSPGFLQENIKDMAASLAAPNSTVLRNDATFFDGHPARETLVRGKNGGTTNEIMIWVGSRVYHLEVAAGPILGNGDRQRFVQSFHVLTD